MKRLLLIEDDPDTTYIIEVALAGKYTVFTKKDGIDINATVLVCMPDIVLIDNFIGLKKANEIVMEIRSAGLGRALPFVLFSGHHDIERLAEEIGAVAYLRKPFKLAELYFTIARTLALQSTPDQETEGLF